MLVLLDIDGVMVPAASWKKPEMLEDGFPMFSQKAIDVIKRLITNDTTVVLTTSHKSKYTVAKWKQIFDKRGIKINKLKSLEANHDNLDRKSEILRWIKSNKVDKDFVIIDDDKSLNALPTGLKKHLILANPLVGLTREHLLQAGAILNNEQLAK